MLKLNFKEILLNGIIFLTIFFIDRISKIYIMNIAELNNKVDIYISPYLNFYLIWNKGIAFGLLSFDGSFIYNLISTIIAIISLVVLILIIKSEGLKRYSLIFVLGGAVANLFDRIYYSAVPDFIDFHIGDYHWFVFNVADIFITFGVICLILLEIMNKNKVKNEVN
jgi:signal peptidase II|tara:strand:+ start:244 stop:744 length:501 start_codon:yes stop_codon:yes gene_type:complete